MTQRVMPTAELETFSFQTKWAPTAHIQIHFYHLAQHLFGCLIYYSNPVAPFKFL